MTCQEEMQTRIGFREGCVKIGSTQLSTTVNGLRVGCDEKTDGDTRRARVC